ncbi:MAG: hypothetical protein GF384_02985, partial [Elusimicrobia bacterium]|nr:hypothetical protein [Elusimicrobiota bacterium]
KKPMSSVSKLCPHCGEERLVKSESKVLMCPRCNCELEKFDYRKTKLKTCPQCNGLWVDVKDFRLLTSEHDIYRDDTVSPKFVRKAPPKPERYFPCPQCGELMVRVNFKRISNVLIDLCRDCGFWLDAGELQQIRSFIASGGLREKEDKELIKHSEQIGSLNTRVTDLEFMQKILHLWNAKRWIFKGF